MKLRGTWWPDASGDRCEPWEMDWPQFIDNLRAMKETPKEIAPLIKLASFGSQATSRGSLRHDANLLEVFGLEGDYDAEEMSPEEAVRRLEKHQLRAVVVTTHRHKPEAPRWRVFAPLAVGWQPKRRAELVAALNGALGGVLAPESFRLSQSYYIGRPPEGDYRVLTTFDDPLEGHTIDQLPPSERNELEVWPPTKVEPRAKDAEPIEPGEGVPDLIWEMLEHVSPEGYDEWIRIGMALHWADPVGGVDIWDKWSSSAEKYKGRADIEWHWASFRHRAGKAITTGAIINAAREGGYQGPIFSQREIQQRIEAMGVDLSAFDIHSLPQPDGDVPMFASLALLLSRPELLAPPVEVIPRIAWRGRTTGLIGPDKSGKSTLMGHAVAALTNGHEFLDRPVEQGTALVVAPDEAVGDTVRRLIDVGADPDRVRLLTLHPERLLDYLREEMAKAAPTLLVVDSLAEWARLIAGRAPEDGDSSGWGAVVRPLVQLSRDFNCATVMLHHPRRSDGQYRGSGEIAAALDCLLEIRLPNKDDDESTRRYFSGRARWPIEEFAVQLHGDTYRMANEALPLESKISIDLQVAGPSTRNAQAKRLQVRKATYLEVVQRMLDAGQLFEKNGMLHAGSRSGSET